MENERDQLSYGNLCRHGTNIGTPTGADFMCQYCEDGLTQWRVEGQFALKIESDIFPYPMTIAEWWEHDTDNAWNRIVAQSSNSDLFFSGAILKHNPTYSVVRIGDGYWDYPDI